MPLPCVRRVTNSAGGACSEGARWCGAGAVRGWRRAEPVYHSGPADAAVQRPAPRLHQQAGPRG